MLDVPLLFRNDRTEVSHPLGVDEVSGAVTLTSMSEVQDLGSIGTHWFLRRTTRAFSWCFLNRSKIPLNTLFRPLSLNVLVIISIRAMEALDMRSIPVAVVDWMLEASSPWLA